MMKESAFLDLLECPVCLERLDASAKVLPCQHTFCKRCLQGILSSRNELRCPECRTLVNCSVDNLPSNILLVRLLDGIKQRPQRLGVGDCASNTKGTGNVVRPQAQSTGMRDQVLSGHLQRSPPMRFNSAANQLIELEKPSDSGIDLDEGISTPQISVQKPSDTKKNTRKRHSFTSITISNKSIQASLNRRSVEISGPVLISSSNPAAAARIGELTGGLSCSAPSQVHISTTGLVVTPPSSSPVTTATTFTFPSETSYRTVSVDSLPLPPPPPPQASAIGDSPLTTLVLSAGQKASPLPTDQNTNGRWQQQRPTVYVAIFPYSPQKDDELELRKGEMFLVLALCQDGWFKGTSMHTGKTGVFPGNYMAPITRVGSGSTQLKMPIAVASQAGWGVTTVSPSPITTASQEKPPGTPPVLNFGKPLTPKPVSTAMVSVAHIQPSNQPAKVLMHMTDQMTVNQAHNIVRTAAVHSQERPTAAVTPIQAQSPMALISSVSVVPHLSLHPAHRAYAVSTVAKHSTGPVNCATTSLTRPSINADVLEGEEHVRPIAPVSDQPTSANRLDKENKKEKKGLLKLLSGASTKRKPRLSHPSFPALESEWTTAEPMQGAIGPEIPTGAFNHCHTVSCPVESEGVYSCTEGLQRRSSSLDSNVPIAPPPRQPCSSLNILLQDARPIVCERYRVMVSYPAQSENELELKEGDIVFVHKKREDGWFKGTLQKNGKTGLFPGNFVDSI